MILNILITKDWSLSWRIVKNYTYCNTLLRYESQIHISLLKSDHVTNWNAGCLTHYCLNNNNKADGRWYNYSTRYLTALFSSTDLLLRLTIAIFWSTKFTENRWLSSIITPDQEHEKRSQPKRFLVQNTMLIKMKFFYATLLLSIAAVDDHYQGEIRTITALADRATPGSL